MEAAASMAWPVGVLGAGGKMGLHVAAMLRKALDRAGRPGVPVYAVSRFGSVNSLEEFAGFGVEKTIATDLLDARALESLPDMGTVFFLAGIKFGTGNDPDRLSGGSTRRCADGRPAFPLVGVGRPLDRLRLSLCAC